MVGYIRMIRGWTHGLLPWKSGSSQMVSRGDDGGYGEFITIPHSLLD